MANRFGQFYVPCHPHSDDPVIFDNLPSTTVQSCQSIAPQMVIHSRIHDEVREQARKKKDSLKKKSVKTAEKEKRRDYIDSGSGHDDILSYFTSPQAHHKRSIPVTGDKIERNKKQCMSISTSATAFSSTDVDQNTASSYNDVLLNELIRNNHEQEDEEELERQEKAYTASQMETEYKASQEVEVIAVGYPKQKLDDAIVNSIEGFVCKGCGNCKDDCHDQMFGVILTHEILTSMQEMEPLEATDEWMLKEFTEKYRLFLRFHCFHMYGKYDEKQDYSLPLCIVKGSFAFTNTLVKHEAIMFHIKNKRTHGVGELFFNRAIVSRHTSVVKSED